MRKSPLAPLFQRGEVTPRFASGLFQAGFAACRSVAKRLVLPFEKGGLGGILFLLLTIPATAVELRVADDASVFAIVTHKAGIAAGKAHNHFVAAQGYDLRLEATPDAPESLVFEIELAADELRVDDAQLQATWFPRLEALGILAEPFGELSDKDREKIRASMVGPKQLDTARFPTIKARVTGVAEEPTTLGEVELPYRVTLAFEVHGETAERPVAASAKWEGDTLRVEAAGTFNFTDFGIKPYSAFLGAVKNTDEFHVYVSFEAAP